MDTHGLGRIPALHLPMPTGHPPAAELSSVISYCRCAELGDRTTGTQSPACRSMSRQPQSIHHFEKFRRNTKMALTAPANHDAPCPKHRPPSKHASARRMFHPLDCSQTHSHTNKRVICHCYAASRCLLLPYSCCRPLGASSALFAAHGGCDTQAR